MNRPKSDNASTFSGGIAALVKTELQKGVSLSRSDIFSLWLKLDKLFFGLKDDIYLCITYLPPDNSTYSRKLDLDCMDILEECVITTINKAGLRLNKEKCLLRKRQLNFLGHIFDADGMHADTAKVQAVRDLAAPTGVAELRWALGMINYLGRYIPDLSTVLQPLNKLLGSDVAWTWDVAQVEAYRKVKELVSSAPILTYYDPEKPIVVSADASSYGLGGVLLQHHGEGLKPVAFCFQDTNKCGI